MSTEGVFIGFFVLEFLHGVRDEFTDDVSDIAVGSIFTGHKEDSLSCS
jgi:hypothetical protein